MKKVLNSSMVLTGTFIGAGFASGQEVWQYFGIFGKFGIFGAFISCVLLGAFTYCTADNINFMGEREYLKKLCRFKWVNRMLNGYMVLIFCTMITAFGECLNQVFHLPKIYGVILMDFVTIITLYFGATGVIRLNCVVTPLIILGIVFAVFENNAVDVFSYNNFVTSSVVYTSYNVIAIPFVLVGMRDMLSAKKYIFGCSAVFGVSIFVLALCILRLLKGINSVASIPLLEAVSSKYVVVLIFVMAMSMLTTAVSNGYGFVNGISLNKNVTLVLVFVFALVFSLFKFSFIVKYLYSFFGYMGLYILFVNFYIFIKNREKPRKLKINNNK